MKQIVAVAELGDLPPGARKLVRTAGREIALFNVEGTIYAIDDSCPHAGSSLSMGRLCGNTIQCRAHGLKFDLSTGLMKGVPDYGVASYPVVVQDDTIAVEL